jgi:hypothetical protein
VWISSFLEEFREEGFREEGFREEGFRVQVKLLTEFHSATQHSPPKADAPLAHEIRIQEHSSLP